MFHIGQRVECVNAHFTNPHKEGTAAWSRYPAQGETLTVRSVSAYKGNAFPGCPYALQFNEIGGIGMFASVRFRPLTNRKTDISIFTKMLNKDPVNA